MLNAKDHQKVVAEVANVVSMQGALMTPMSKTEIICTVVSATKALRETEKFVSEVCITVICKSLRPNAFKGTFNHCNLRSITHNFSTKIDFLKVFF